MTASYDARLGLYIAGEWLGTEGRETRDVLNPATGQGQAALPLATSARVCAAGRSTTSELLCSPPRAS